MGKIKHLNITQYCADTKSHLNPSTTYPYINESHSTKNETVVYFAVITCNPLPAVPFSAVQFTDTTYQSAASYVCIPGYQISSGNAVRNCNSAGTWDGTEPNCTSKLHSYIAEKILSSDAGYWKYFFCLDTYEPFSFFVRARLMFIIAVVF